MQTCSVTSELRTIDGALGSLKKIATSAIIFVSFGTQQASAQTGAFAFGNGGLAYTPQGERGYFNECTTAIEVYGIAECAGVTMIGNAWNKTETTVSTTTGNENLYIVPSTSAGAAASINQYGAGTTQTHCRTTAVGGSSVCGTGAYAAPDGAFSIITIESAR